MSAPNPLIAPTTSIVLTQLQGQEADAIVLYVTAALGVGETVEVLLPTTTGAVRQYIDPITATPVVLTPTVGAVLLPGGILYTIRKNVTVGATGVDYQLKPRIGPH